jgi:hypothetical protein
MRVIHYYPRGLFHRALHGPDVAAANQLEFFKHKSWQVDCAVGAFENGAAEVRDFRKRFPWVGGLVEVGVPWNACFDFRQQCLRHAAVGRSKIWRWLCAEPVDLFFTNYSFTAGLLEALPSGCRRAIETVERVATRGTIEETHNLPDGAEAVQKALTDLRGGYHARIESDLLRLFDCVIVATPADAAGMSNRTHRIDHLFIASSGHAAVPEFDLVYVSGDHDPNGKGFRWFYRHVYVPYLRAHGIRLAVIGELTLEFHDSSLKKIVDPNFRHACRGRAILFPAIEGSSQAMPMIQALGLGRPIMATPLVAAALPDAAEALTVIDIKAAPKEAASAILALLANPVQVERLVKASRAYAEAHHSRERYFAAMDAALTFAKAE